MLLQVLFPIFYLPQGVDKTATVNAKQIVIIFQVTKFYVLVSHSSSIWDIKNLCCENMHDPSLACTARGCLGGISFATCSTDGTIRIWDIALQSDCSDDAEDLKTELFSSSCLGNMIVRKKSQFSCLLSYVFLTSCALLVYCCSNCRDI